MGFTYESGVWLAFLIGLVKVCISTSALFSLRARNLKKVGIHYHCFRGDFISSKPTGVLGFLFYLFYMLMLAPLFSWLSVLSSAWGFISWLSNRTPVPEKIKEAQYKIAHLDLSKDELTKLLSAIAIALGTTLPVTSDSPESDEEPNTYVLEPGEWYSEVRVNTSQRRLVFYGHTPDYDSVFNSIYEYRFEGGKLIARLIEDSVEHYGKVEFKIKDNVVLESEIRSRDAEKKFKFGNLDEELKNLKEAVEWSEFRRYDVRFFVMSRHPETFPIIEFKKAVRQDLERVQSGVLNFVSVAKGLRVVVVETDQGIDFKDPEHFSDSEKDSVKALFKEESILKFGISLGELQSHKKIKGDLLKFLGEKTAA